MDINFASVHARDFDPHVYLKLLVSVAKADRTNGQPEIDYIKRQAGRLPVDFQSVWASTDKAFEIGATKVSRFTAMAVLKDCIALASLDGNFSLDEKEKIYLLAERLNIPLSDVKALEKWHEECVLLEDKWNRLVRGEQL